MYIACALTLCAHGREVIPNCAETLCKLMGETEGDPFSFRLTEEIHLRGVNVR